MKPSSKEIDHECVSSKISCLGRKLTTKRKQRIVGQKDTSRRTFRGAKTRNEARMRNEETEGSKGRGDGHAGKEGSGGEASGGVGENCGKEDERIWEKRR